LIISTLTFILPYFATFFYRAVSLATTHFVALANNDSK